MKTLLLVLLLVLALSGCCTGLIERLYCGMDNCYDLLGVTREATSAEIRRAYRKLAIVYHPDKNKEKGARKKFEKIATAYEVLKDEEERSNYDYMLDHPEEVYGHYYRYYRKRTPSIDVRLVVGVMVALISLCQYSVWMHSYRMAIAYALGNPGYRARAREFAQVNGLLKELEHKKVGKDFTKADLRAEESNILSKVLEENLNITGGYEKPKITDILFFQLILLPYTILKYLSWYGQWVWKFTIKKEPYGPEEREYLTRKALKLTEQKWAALGAERREEMLERELWVRKNFDIFHQEQHEAMKAATADSSKHKMYRRYMKRSGKKVATSDWN